MNFPKSHAQTYRFVPVTSKPFGGTGVGVRTLVHLAQKLAKN